MYLVLLLLTGIILCIYLWRSKITVNHLQENREFRKSIFQETIQSLHELKLPKIIDNKTTEKYYMKLSHICRIFIKEKYFIRATEMTSEELKKYFQSIGINKELIKAWSHVNQIADMAKYAGQMPEVSHFKRDKEAFILIIKSFHKINSQLSL